MLFSLVVDVPRTIVGGFSGGCCITSTSNFVKVALLSVAPSISFAELTSTRLGGFILSVKYRNFLSLSMSIKMLASMKDVL